MRLTEFWARMEAALGPSYARAWADRCRHRRASGRARWPRRSNAGEPAKDVWAAVWRALELPASER